VKQALVALAIIAFSPFSLEAQSVRVSVIDRGQADGIVIRTPHSQWVAIDGGTNKQQADLMHQWGVTTIAVAIISHRHFDHNGGMDDVLGGFTVQRFIGRLDNCQGVAQDDKIRQILADRGIPSEEPHEQSFAVDGVNFRILPMDPTDDGCPEDENNNSVLVRLDYGQFSMLFAGDAEGPERSWLVTNHADLLDVDVLKAAHHGANNGSSDRWLTATSPERVVISAGVNAKYGHPQAEAVDAYIATVGDNARLFCTNRHKTVTVHGYEDGRVRIYRQNRITKSCAYDGTHY
jgi:competence protein ComEC